MTVLELLSKHLPIELAAIVTGYVIREDWRLAMNKNIEQLVLAMHSRYFFARPDGTKDIYTGMRGYRYALKNWSFLVGMTPL